MSHIVALGHDESRHVDAAGLGLNALQRERIRRRLTSSEMVAVAWRGEAGASRAWGRLRALETVRAAVVRGLGARRRADVALREE